MRATPGAVASGHARVSEAAAEMLRAGGNAFDAAVAAGFAASVAEPMFTSLGGGGFLLARTGSSAPGGAGREVLFDFFADTPGRGLASSPRPHFEPITVQFPASDQVFNVGLGSVAVPGTLAGLLHVHAALGSRSLGEVVTPARRLARDGVELNEHQAYVIALLEPIHASQPRAAALYLPRARAPRAGERLSNPDLARFLARLPERGGAALYRGEVARAVDEDMRAGGGLLTAADLAGYRVAERAPLVLERDGLRVLTNPPPGFGGELLSRALALHAELPAADWGSAEELCQRAAVMQEVDRQRAAGEGFALEAAARRARRASGGTTHVSVVDADGNAASLSLSNGEGSGYVVPGTGIQLNNMLGEDDLHPDGFHAAPPGERIASMMCPTLVIERGAPRLALGSGGSKRIRSAIAQVLTAVVDHGRPLREAVEAPRLHWDGARVQAEPGFVPEALAGLEARFATNRWPERSLYFGGVHAVAGPDAAAADPRRQGAALVISR